MCFLFSAFFRLCRTSVLSPAEENAVFIPTAAAQYSFGRKINKENKLAVLQACFTICLTARYIGTADAIYCRRNAIYFALQNEKDACAFCIMLTHILEAGE